MSEDPVKKRGTGSTMPVELARSWRGRLDGKATVLFCLTAALCVISGPATASASLPPYDGDMTFPAIEGPSDPEEFSWEVQLGPEQTLEQVDDQHAEVYYEYEHHPSYGITAEAAHDAEGHGVPTSLVVSGGNVITLVVHHRDGNPAAGGAPFAYPVSAGPAFKITEGTVIVDGPPDEQELREARERIERENQAALEEEWEAAFRRKAVEACLVPTLNGRSLKASKRRLREANCRIGDVSKLKGATAKTGKVLSQRPRPGTVLAPGSRVSVKLG